MDIQVGNPKSTYLLTLVVIGLILALVSALVRRRAWTQFATETFRTRLLPKASGWRKGLSTWLMVGSLALLVLALLDIRWGKTTREVPQKGIEVIFALDVSRSMLAEDVSPNRLVRAKQQIKDMLEEMAGDRVGLVVFAGTARQSVPLTSHYDDFRQVLDSVGPHSIPRGGSRLGEALQTAADGFISKTNDHKAIVLFTDGEDQESQPLEVASRLFDEQGIRVFTVGLGDMDQGSRIPVEQGQRQAYVEHQGQQVWSKLNGQVLNGIAARTSGAYIPAGTKRVNMADVYHGYVADVGQTEFESAKINAYIPRFQWFAAAALLLMVIEILVTTGKWQPAIMASPAVHPGGGALPESSGQRPPHNARKMKSGSRRSQIAAAAILSTCLATGVTEAQMTRQVAQEINAANALLRSQQTSEAIQAFSSIDAPAADQNPLNYNLAVAHYRNGDIDAAKTLFTQAASAADTRLAANSRYNLGNCLYAEALAKAEQDPRAAVTDLQTAIDHYRSALRLDRDNADARANIELARHLIQQLQDQQPQDQQPQDQQSQDQQSQDQQSQEQQPQDQQPQDQQPQDQQSQDQQSQDQQSQDQQDQQSGDQQSQDPQQGEPSPDDRPDSATDPQSSDSPAQSGDENLEPSGQQDSQADPSADAPPQPASPQEDDRQGDPGNPDPQNAATEPGSPENSPQRPSPQPRSSTPPASQSANRDDGNDPAEGTAVEAESAESQQDPAETPNGQLTAANPSSGQDTGDAAQVAALNPQDQQQGRMSREEALKMLQSVRDRDMLRRLRQQQRERSRRQTVDRDW